MNGIHSRSYWASFSIVALMLTQPLPSPAHQGEDHPAQPKPPETSRATGAGLRADIEERLGESIPSGLTFVDTEGNACQLSSKWTRPTLLALVYYGCTAECNEVLDNLADALRKVPQKPGADFQVLSVSFDETENLSMAARKRDNVMKILGPTFPRDAWLFLTGDAKTIEALTRAVGFHFLRKDNDIVHSTALVFIAPGGKIVRYLHGTRYLPAEISLALTEAETGKIGVSTRKMLSYCFRYDPAGRRYTVDLLRVAGLVLIVGMAILLMVMLRSRGNRKKTPGNGPDEP